jgi:glutamate--cysteine ligase
VTTSARPLSLADVTTHVRDHVFGAAGLAGDTPAVRDQVGIELEWLTGYRDRQRLSLEQAQAVVADLSPLPNGSRITIEPGGQLELSSAPFATVDDAIEGTATDLYVLDQACAQRRIELFALGADPVRAPERIVTAPRYAAMESFFDRQGRSGRTMMCNTAAIQLNLGLGDEDMSATRWRVANLLGPVLIACFANSPFAAGGSSGWKSTRLRAWWTLDPSRSAPVVLDGDPVERWVDYLLDAQVMLVRRDGRHAAPTLPLTFGAWMHEGLESGPPTLDDLEYHLTTLFPPVRPRGWLELRMFDALPTPFWQVAVAVTAALVRTAEVAPTLERVLAPTSRLWIDAAQLGLGHPALRAAAAQVFDLALHLLEESDDPLTDLASLYLDRWVARGRCPADDRLDQWRRDGTLFPPSESPVPYGVDALTVATGAPR